MELNITDIRENLADALNRVAYAGERIILKRRTKSVAALVSIEDLALLEQLEDAQDVKAAPRP
jgi:prevent-host-death family protein